MDRTHLGFITINYIGKKVGQINCCPKSAIKIIKCSSVIWVIFEQFGLEQGSSTIYFIKTTSSKIFWGELLIYCLHVFLLCRPNLINRNKEQHSIHNVIVFCFLKPHKSFYCSLPWESFLFKWWENKKVLHLNKYVACSNRNMLLFCNYSQMLILNNNHSQ